MNEREKELLRNVIRDNIDELTLLIEKDDEDNGEDDDAAKLDLLINSGVSAPGSSPALHNLRLLKENLTWLDSEEGGMCEACGNEIASARLAALPATRLCITCAGEREK